VTVGRLHNLAFQGELTIADKVRATLGAQSQGDVVASFQAGATLSGAELVDLALRRNERDAIAPLLDRSVTLNLEVPGLRLPAPRNSLARRVSRRAG